MSKLDVTKKTLLKTQSHEQNYKCSLRNAKLELKIQDWDKERITFLFKRK